MIKQKSSIATRVAAGISRLTKTERVFLGVLLILFLSSVLALAWQVNIGSMVEVPVAGGSLREGLIGAPRFINPLLAETNTDRDLVALVYSGLLRVGTDGDLLPDLAQSYTVSEDGKEYNFILKSGLTWHDGEPLTVDDIVFTVNQLKNPLIRSPLRINWDGVEVSKVSSHEITFKLVQPYSLFLDSLTIGILPSHLWENVAPEAFHFSPYNVESIGSGPYKIAKQWQDKNNLPTAYEFVPFNNFALGRPKINKLFTNFYPSEELLVDAYENGMIDSLSSISPKRLAEFKTASTQILTEPLPRVFGVFFNQNQAEIFTDQKVREALDSVIDRDELVSRVFSNYAVAADRPLPNLAESEGEDTTAAETEAPTKDKQQLAEDTLTKQGWKKDEVSGTWKKKFNGVEKTLSFTLSTADTVELAETAEYLKEAWGKLGIPVEVAVSDASTLRQNKIRLRDYDTLLFGLIVGRKPDLYSFWHSSQRLDPGLNVAMYANITVDQLLDKVKTTNPLEKEKIDEENRKAADIIAGETPAVFLYSPKFIYLLPNYIENAKLPPLNYPSERFASIYQWHVATEKVWSIFSEKSNNN